MLFGMIIEYIIKNNLKYYENIITKLVECFSSI